MTPTVISKSSSDGLTYIVYSDHHSEVVVTGSLRTQIIRLAKKRGIAPQRYLKRMIDAPSFAASVCKLAQAGRSSKGRSS